MTQYVDDLLLLSETLSYSQEDTVYLQQQLASKRHKVSKEKLQVCLPKEKYFGHLIPKNGLLINPAWIKKSLVFALTKTKKQKDF